jgi:hypothetical protein
MEMAYRHFELDQRNLYLWSKEDDAGNDAVSSRSAFTAGLAADQGWKTKRNKSTIPLYTNIKLSSKV